MSRKTRQNPEGLTLLYAMQTAPHYGKLHAPGKSQKMWTLIPALPLINISPLWASASFIGLPSGHIRLLFFLVWWGSHRLTLQRTDKIAFFGSCGGVLVLKLI